MTPENRDFYKAWGAGIILFLALVLSFAFGSAAFGQTLDDGIIINQDPLYGYKFMATYDHARMEVSDSTRSAQLNVGFKVGVDGRYYFAQITETVSEYYYAQDSRGWFVTDEGKRLTERWFSVGTYGYHRLWQLDFDRGTMELLTRADAIVIEQDALEVRYEINEDQKGLIQRIYEMSADHYQGEG